MANKYKYNSTIDDKIQEEDRECQNDLLRAQASYYTTLNNINLIILNSLKSMDSKDIKQLLMNNNLKIPVKKYTK